MQERGGEGSGKFSQRFVIKVDGWDGLQAAGGKRLRLGKVGFRCEGED